MIPMPVKIRWDPDAQLSIFQPVYLDLKNGPTPQHCHRNRKKWMRIYSPAANSGLPWHRYAKYQRISWSRAAHLEERAGEEQTEVMSYHILQAVQLTLAQLTSETTKLKFYFISGTCTEQLLTSSVAEPPMFAAPGLFILEAPGGKESILNTGMFHTSIIKLVIHQIEVQTC